MAHLQGARIMMKSKFKILALLLSAAMCLSVTGCKGVAKEPTSTAESAETATAETATGETAYSAALDDNGFYTGIDALDYIQLPEGYESLTIPEEYTTVSEDLIDSDILDMMRNLNITQAVTDRPAQEGDVVVIDFVGTINGVEFQGGSYNGYSVEIGNSTLISGFAEQIVGHSVGETFDVTVTFPDNYGQTQDVNGNTIELSNQEAVFKTTVVSISVYNLTDEDVVNAFGDSYTLNDGSKIDTVDKARQYFEEYELYRAATTYLADYLLNNSVVIKDIPESIYEQERELETAYLINQAAQYGMTTEEFLATGDYDSIEAYLEDGAEYIEHDVKYCFIIQAIAEDLNIQVTDADIEKNYAGDAENAISAYGKGFVSQQTLAVMVMDRLAQAAM